MRSGLTPALVGAVIGWTAADQKDTGDRQATHRPSPPQGRPLLQAGVKFNATPLMQYRRCVGGGPSSKTCPRWLPQFEQ